MSFWSTIRKRITTLQSLCKETRWSGSSSLLHRSTPTWRLWWLSFYFVRSEVLAAQLPTPLIALRSWLTSLSIHMLIWPGLRFHLFLSWCPWFVFWWSSTRSLSKDKTSPSCPSCTFFGVYTEWILWPILSCTARKIRKRMTLWSLTRMMMTSSSNMMSSKYQWLRLKSESRGKWKPLLDTTCL